MKFGRIPLALRSSLATMAAACAVLSGCMARAPLDSDVSSYERVTTSEIPSEHRAAQTSSPFRVVLIALDGARWQDIFRGPDANLLAHEQSTRHLGATAEELTPAIHALISKGAAFGDADQGSDFEATGPNFISLPGYTEMLTGRASVCQANDCVMQPDETLADVFRAEPGAREEDVVVMSSWESISRVAAHDPTKVTVSCGRTHGDTRLSLDNDVMLGDLETLGAQTSPAPGHDDYRPDVLTGPLAIEYLARRAPRFMFLSLGDTDEFGHADSYSDYLDALQRADAIIGELVRVNDALRGATNTVWFVTADHGRSLDFTDHGRAWPESKRSWLVASGAEVPKLGVVSHSMRHELRDIAPTVRAWLGLPLEDRDDAGLPIQELIGLRIDERP